MSDTRRLKSNPRNRICIHRTCSPYRYLSKKDPEMNGSKRIRMDKIDYSICLDIIKFCPARRGFHNPFEYRQIEYVYSETACFLANMKH